MGNTYFSGVFVYPLKVKRANILDLNWKCFAKLIETKTFFLINQFMKHSDMDFIKQ